MKTKFVTLALGIAFGLAVALVTPLRAQFVYVANFSGNSISAYGIGSNGGLTPVPGQPFAAGNSPFSVAVDPTGKFAYVANEFGNNVSAYSIGPTGVLTPVAGSPFNAGGHPVSVAVDPTGKFAYVANANDNTVSAYSIGSDGSLTELTSLGSPFATGQTPVSVAVDPTGKFAFVYVVNSQGNNVSAYSIGSNGALAAVAGSPFGVFGIGGSPNSVAVDPIGQLAFVVSQRNNSVSVFSIGPTGTLNAVEDSPFATGAVPVSVAVDPAGRFVYVANSGDSTVSAYSIGSDPVLAPVGSPIAAGTDPRSVAVDPTGRFVYAANYISNNVSGYTIDPSTGALAAIAGSLGNPFPAGLNPTSVAITPLVPFATSFAKLEISAKGFQLKESFTLGANSNGINPLTENVTLQIGSFSGTIPPGSFKQIPQGRFAFEGVINGASLQVQIVPLGNNSFTFKAEGTGVNLTGLTNPVTVVLTAGMDSGATAVTAQFQ